MDKLSKATELTPIYPKEGATGDLPGQVPPVTPEQSNIICNALVLGESVGQAAARAGVSVEQAVCVLDEFEPQGRTVRQRRGVALARIDAICRAIAPRLLKGESEAIRDYLLLQKREAQLVGLDMQPERAPTDITIKLSWLGEGRLAYREGRELAEDITPRTSQVVAIDRNKDTGTTVLQYNKSYFNGVSS